MNDEEFSDYAARVQQVEELAKTQPWRLFFEEALDGARAHRTRLFSGRLDYEDYLRTAGFIQGLQYVLAVPDRMREEFQREAERRNLRGNQTAG